MEDYYLTEGSADPIRIFLPRNSKRGRPKGSAKTKATGRSRKILPNESYNQALYNPLIVRAQTRDDVIVSELQHVIRTLRMHSAQSLRNGVFQIKRILRDRGDIPLALYALAKAVFLIHLSSLRSLKMDGAINALGGWVLGGLPPDPDPDRPGMTEYLGFALHKAWLAKVFDWDTIECNLLIAHIYCAAKLPTEAEPFISRALELDPEGLIVPDSEEYLTFLLWNGKVERVLERTFARFSVNPHDIVAYLLYAYASLAKGNVDQAYAAVLQGLADNHADSRLSLLLLHILSELDRPEDELRGAVRGFLRTLDHETAEQWRDKFLDDFD